MNFTVEKIISRLPEGIPEEDFVVIKADNGMKFIIDWENNLQFSLEERDAVSIKGLAVRGDICIPEEKTAKFNINPDHHIESIIGEIEKIGIPSFIRIKSIIDLTVHNPKMEYLLENLELEVGDWVEIKCFSKPGAALYPV